MPLHPSLPEILLETRWVILTAFYFLTTGQTDVIWTFCTEDISSFLLVIAFSSWSLTVFAL
jgi:hypothetical protein